MNTVTGVTPLTGRCLLTRSRMVGCSFVNPGLHTLTPGGQASQPACLTRYLKTTFLRHGTEHLQDKNCLAAGQNVKDHVIEDILRTGDTPPLLYVFATADYVSRREIRITAMRQYYPIAPKVFIDTFDSLCMIYLDSPLQSGQRRSCQGKSGHCGASSTRRPSRRVSQQNVFRIKTS